MTMPDTTSITLDHRQGQDLLSRLPEEIIEIISACLAQHVIDLRSTCRELQHKTWHSFSKKFFTSRHIWIDSHALSTLQDISREPRFAHSVSQLTIHCDEIDIQRLRLRVAVQGPSKTRQTYSEVLDRGIEQQALLKSGAAIEQLSSCLRQLPNLTSIALDLVPPSCDHWPQTHYKIPYGEDYRVYFNNTSPHDSVSIRHSILLIALEAILRSQQPLTRFQGLIPIPVDAVALLPPSIFPSLSIPFKSLSYLDLRLTPPKVGVELPLWEKSLASLLGLCPSLSHLELWFISAGSVHHETPVVDSLASWPSYEGLRVLSLSEFAVKPEALADYLARHFKTLKTLGIDVLRASQANAPWRCVLESIPAGATLDRFLFSVHNNGEYEDCDIIDAEGAGIMQVVENVLKLDAVWEDARPRDETESLTPESSNFDGLEGWDEVWDEDSEDFDDHDPGSYPGNGYWPMWFDGYEV